MANAGGIRAMEKAQKIVRGSAASAESFNGAFGLVPNKAVLKIPGVSVIHAMHAVMMQ